MNEKCVWVTRQLKCPEGERIARLLVERHDEDGRLVLKSLSCDNPRLRDVDNWECQWSCWKEIADE